MPTPRLLKKNTLIVTRKNEGQSDYDDNGNWVESTDTVSLTVKGNLQPFRLGKTKEELPEGVKANEARVFYTVTELLTADDAGDGQEADVADIKGIPFEVYHVEDWDTPANLSSHYKCILIRQDKMSGY